MSELLESELDNFNAALDWWSTEPRVAEGLRLAVALNSLWSRLGQYAAGRRWLEAMLELADRTAPASAFRAERAVALTEVGTLAGLQADAVDHAVPGEKGEGGPRPGVGAVPQVGAGELRGQRAGDRELVGRDLVGDRHEVAVRNDRLGGG